MQRELVEGRRWVSKQDYLEGLAFSQLSPGPLAAQLAMYRGWLRAGAFGATLVGIAFILPSFLMVLALAALYVHYGSLPWIQGMFYGIGAAVIAIIVRSAIKLVRTTLGKDWLLWVIFGLIALTTAWTKSEIVWLFVLSGIIGVLVKAPPTISPRASAFVFIGGVDRLRIGMYGLAPLAAVGALFLFFLKAGAFVFWQRSGDRAISLWWSSREIPLAHRATVCGRGSGGHDHTGACSDYRSFHRLPGCWISWCVRGCRSGVCPTILHRRRCSPVLPPLRSEPAREGIRRRCYGGCVGAIAGAAYILARRSLVDLPTVLIGLVTLAILMFTKRIPEPIVILAAGAVGVVLHGMAR